jgi:hypothetical protein|nr:MAG TPA: hypothetical protein [Caudoviricetes sp.]
MSWKKAVAQFQLQKYEKNELNLKNLKKVVRIALAKTG